MLKPLSLLLLSLALCSCSRGWYGAVAPSAQLHAVRNICLDVPADVKPAMVRAVAQWDLALNGKLLLRTDQGACDFTVAEAATGCRPNALACTNALGGSVITMIRGSYERQPGNILAHELGHALGAQHFEGTLMAVAGAPQDCPDQTTMAQVASYQHWNLAELRWCAL
jgi:hypothetical protein